LGGIYLTVRNYEQGTQLLEEALAINPNNSQGWSNLSAGWRRLGRLDEAIKAARKAVMLKPDYAEAYSNMGNALRDQGNLDDAVTSYRKAVTLKPDYAEAYSNLGNILKDQGKLYNAITLYRKALSLKPDFSDAYHNMGDSLIGIKFSKPEPGICELIFKLLENESVRPNDISNAAISLLKFQPVVMSILEKNSGGKLAQSIKKTILDLSNIPLLLKLMDNCPIPDLEIESIFKEIRSQLLLSIFSFKNDTNILPFQISLALQCFANEYLYDKTDLEIETLTNLECRIEIDMSKGEQPSPNELACLASYKALYEYPWINLVSIPVELQSLFQRQALEYKEEKNLSLKIPILQGITDRVSLKVRDQYEKYPYPRWVKLKLNIFPKPIPVIARELKIKIKNTSINEVISPQILIAGCGTGQHPIETSSLFKDCNIVAVDLSLSSLSYAKRKTEELGILNIEYIQADILDLRSLNKKFDIIECAGVLHHMNDPIAGWKVLVSCLNSGGLMNIGLYSAVARQHVVQIRDEIKQLGINTSDDSMRSFRNQISNSEKKHHKFISSSLDFYSMSTIRDLLFHVQEHRFTIPKIKHYLDQLDLVFCGFGDPKIVQKFNLNNPTVNSVYDLDKWDIFEQENPHTFGNMYQFWCQKSC
jgi:ubiquinone/menaquinone biosynthesis C-methylase UbiE